MHEHIYESCTHQLNLFERVNVTMKDEWLNSSLLLKNNYKKVDNELQFTNVMQRLEKRIVNSIAKRERTIERNMYGL